MDSTRERVQGHKLHEEILDNIKSEAVILFFTASWCSPCKGTKEILEPKIEKLNGKIKYYELDAGYYSGIASHFGVSSLPTVMLFHRDKMVNCIRGHSPGKMEEFIGALESLEVGL